MNVPGKIKKLDDVVVNRIAAGEIIQRPANALKELIENSLDAKSTSIQITAKEGGLKLLQIQDNGTGIRKEDMDIVCERFTTSKLQTFEDLQSITTFGFRGEALASISHVSLLTITTKTADEKCAYKASYVDSKLKAPPKSCAGNQGTTILIENLFYNVATRRKALSNTAEEFNKIADVVTKYAIHNPNVAFVLKKHGEITPQVRTPHNSTKMSNVRVLYGNPVSRELLEVELKDDIYKFQMHALVTNPNYTNKKMIFLLFINHRLVECSSIRKMLEELYTFYLPKKGHPWCYISLEIEPQNVDVNVHPTKHEVKFLHENSIIERIKVALDEKLSGNSASRTFYVQARLPKTDITKEVLKEVLPEYEKDEKTKKIRPHQMIRTDASDQKLDKFDFTATRTTTKHSASDSNMEADGESSNNALDNKESHGKEDSMQLNDTSNNATNEIVLIQSDSGPKQVHASMHIESTTKEISESPWSNIIEDTSPSTLNISEREEWSADLSDQSNNKNECKSDIQLNTSEIINDEAEESILDTSMREKSIDLVADKARQQVLKCFANKIATTEEADKTEKKSSPPDKFKSNEHSNNDKCVEIKSAEGPTKAMDSNTNNDVKSVHEFKSYSINNFVREVRLTSVLRLRKEVEDDCHEGLREILSESIFVGCIDEFSALIQSGVNLYLCDTKRLTEQLFYEILIYDFANFGILKFSEPLSIYELALLGLETKEAGWTEEDGPKEELATNVKELLLEKADMMKEYFSMVIDRNGNLKSLPMLLEKYFPNMAGLPLYILRLATEVTWSSEQPCLQNICKETAKYYSQIAPMHGTHDWKYVTEHVLYSSIKESLLPPKNFSHDSTILQIACLPDLYKVFERC